MAQRIPLIPGQRFGRMVVLAEAETRVTPGGQKKRHWHCRCDCGNETTVALSGLRSGGVESCGCLQRERASETGRVPMIGLAFGRLTVVRAAGAQVYDSGKRRRLLWECQCECGEVAIVRGSHLRSGGAKSCGCLKVEVAQSARTHGYAGDSGGGRHPLYKTWQNMRARCQDVNDKNYADYGGRGVTVCDRWQGPEGFPNFLADMGERPTDPPSWTSKMSYWTLDRIDVDGNYEPGNCRWADPHTQATNKRPFKSA